MKGMRFRLRWGLLILALGWIVGCSGTEFPNPGSDSDNGNQNASEPLDMTVDVVSTPSDGLGETSGTDVNTAEATAEEDGSETLFYRHLLNQCVQVWQPILDFDESTEPIHYTQTASPAETALATTYGILVPTDIVLSQQLSIANSIFLNFDGGGETMSSFLFSVETTASDPQFVSDSLAFDVELLVTPTESCVQRLNVQDTIELNGVSQTVMHEQWIYQTAELSAGNEVIVDIYKDLSKTGIQQTVRFSLTLTGPGEAEGTAVRESYEFETE